MISVLGLSFTDTENWTNVYPGHMNVVFKKWPSPLADKNIWMERVWELCYEYK